MERSFLKEKVLRYKYIVNHTSKEIHRVSDVTKKCRIGMLKRAEYCRTTRMEKYMTMGYNGCSKCFKERDNG